MNSELKSTKKRLHFRRLFAYTKGYRGRLFLGGTMILIAAGLSLHMPLLTGRLIDGLTSNDPAIPFEVVAIAMVVLIGMQVLLTLVGGLIIAWIDEKIVAAVRIDAFSRLQQLPYSFYAEQHSGELVSRLTNDVESVGWATTQNMIYVVQALITLLGAGVWMLILSPKLALYACAGVPLFILFILALGRRAYAISGGMQDALASICAHLADCTRHALLVRIFGRQEAETRTFSKLVDKSVGIAMRYNLLSTLYTPAAGIAGFAGTVIVLWMGYGLVGNGRLLAGDLIAFVLYIGTSVGALSSLANGRMQTIEALGAARRLFEIMDSATEPVDGEAFDRLQGKIMLNGLTFQYPGTNRLVIEDLTMTIEAGETIVIVGPSGAGKTTLLHLLCGLYSGFEGDLRLDGRPVQAACSQSLRSQIGFVPQESVLFPGSVTKNIRYGRLDADDDAVRAAARAAGVERFIDDLAEGYDTEVGEGGVKLSSGQRQRICLARALVRDPSILLLDEPTSALDMDSERELLESLANVGADRTCVIVAHQPSVITLADRVLVLERGRVKHFASPGALMEQSDYYKRLATKK